MRFIPMLCLVIMSLYQCTTVEKAPLDSSEPMGLLFTTGLLSNQAPTGTTPTTTASCNPCRIYATADGGPLFQPTSAYTSVAGADSICNSNSMYPGSGVFKALISSSARIACTTANCSGGNAEHTNWVLYANTTYVRAIGGSVVGTTNAVALFTFPLTIAFDTGSNGWATGLNTDWTFAGACTDNLWGTGTAGPEPYGLPVTTSGAIGSGSQTCASSVRLVCVEQ